MTEDPYTDHPFGPATWDASELADAIQDPLTALPTVDNRPRWEAIREHDPTARIAAIIEGQARVEKSRSDPPIKATDILAASRENDRIPYARPNRRRRRRMTWFTLITCLQDTDEYVDHLLNTAWAICEESTWVWSAHLPFGGTGLDGLPHPVEPDDEYIDLGAVITGLSLIEMDRILGDRLHPALRRRIDSEIESRIITPFLARDDFGWLQKTNNWNAVCNGSIISIALYHCEPERAARVITKATKSLQRYLNGFAEDGASPEGVSYWGFGLEHYWFANTVLEAATDGAYSLVTDRLADIAQFPLRFELSPGKYPAFGDSLESFMIRPALATALSHRYGLSAYTNPDRVGYSGLPDETRFFRAWRALVWSQDPAFSNPGTGSTSDLDYSPSSMEYSPDIEWWIARADPTNPDGLVVAAKGGHNSVSHNHNDGGTFIIHHDRTSTFTDLGKPTYPDDFFGPNRYSYLSPRSLGHSVPYPNETEQANGTSYAVTVESTGSDNTHAGIELDLTDCYPDSADLATLTRQVDLEKASPRVVVTDTATLQEPGTFTEMLIADLPMETKGSSSLRVTGSETATECQIHPEPTALNIEHLEEAVNVESRDQFPGDTRDVWRAWVQYTDVESLTVTMTFLPNP